MRYNNEIKRHILEQYWCQTELVLHTSYQSGKISHEEYILQHSIIDEDYDYLKYFMVTLGRLKIV